LPICEKLLRLLERPKMVLIEGGAGVGKTRLALELLRELCTSSCMYAAPRYFDVIKLSDMLGLDASKITLYKVFDPTDFIDIITMEKVIMYDVIVVDQIEYVAAEDSTNEAWTLVLLLVSALKFLSERYGVYTVIVSGKGVFRGLGALANIVKTWCDMVIEMGKYNSHYQLTVYSPKDSTVLLKSRYLIRRGIEWLDC